MKRQPIKHHLNGLIALLLFGVFAVCVLAVLLTGADAYRRLTLRDQAAYDRRTCVQYVATRVRQADGAGCVAVEPFGGSEALVLAEQESPYVTRVYCHEGYMMELYADASAELSPGDGEKIMPADSLAFALEDGLLTVTAGVDGAPSTLVLALRSGEGVGA